jgi:hypothetical protein
MIANKGSEQATSIGDEPGVGKGIKSSTQLDRATWLSWSPDVFMENRPVNRLTDKMLMNNGNTVCLAGHWDPTLKGPHGKELCEEACECVIQEDKNQEAAKAKGKDYRRKDDDCFKNRLRQKGYVENRPTPDTVQNGRLSNPVYTLDQNGNWQLTYSKTPGCENLLTNGRPAGSVIPDCTYMTGGKATEVYEMKFGDDKLRDGQERAHEEIAGEDGESHVINVDKDCDCKGYKEEKEAKAAEAKDALNKLSAAARVMRALQLLVEGAEVEEVGAALLALLAL